MGEEGLGLLHSSHNELMGRGDVTVTPTAICVTNEQEKQEYVSWHSKKLYILVCVKRKT